LALSLLRFPVLLPLLLSHVYSSHAANLISTGGGFIRFKTASEQCVTLSPFAFAFSTLHVPS